MKKLICCLLAFSAIGAIAGCNNTHSECELSYGVKYVYKEDVHKEETEQRYYIFYKNGTAEYHHYSKTDDYPYDGSSFLISAYTKTYKYKIVEDESTVFCFYNGCTFDEIDTAKSKPSLTDTPKFVYTEDFLLNITNANMYVTEEFIEEEVPNFGK